MPRAEGFAVMDVSTSVCDDPKFRRIHRQSPDLVAPAFTAYMAVMAESWKAGSRVAVEDAWPSLLPFDQAVVDALVIVGLLDKRGLLSPKAWRGWFDPARERRDKSRVRWTRYNAKRDADTTDLPRGSDADTATSVPTVRPSVPTEPSVPPVERARAAKNGPKDRDDEVRRAREKLSEDFRAGRISEMDYQRERKVLAS